MFSSAMTLMVSFILIFILSSEPVKSKHPRITYADLYQVSIVHPILFHFTYKQIEVILIQYFQRCI